MAAPSCGHPADRKLTGVPAEYVGMCDHCVISYAIANGLFFGRQAAEKDAADREAGS
jgi:hypothetical protein